MKKIGILFVVGFIFLTSCVYAGNLVKKVYFSPYPILIDDEEYSSEMPILSYQDRTYVALREFSEMLDVDIGFVDETIIIDTMKRNEEKENEEVVEEEKVENVISKTEITNENQVISKSEIVYITQTGTKYHLKSTCSKGNFYSTTLDAAKKDGYTPCKKCVN